MGRREIQNASKHRAGPFIAHGGRPGGAEREADPESDEQAAPDAVVAKEGGVLQRSRQRSATVHVEGSHRPSRSNGRKGDGAAKSEELKEGNGADVTSDHGDAPRTD